MLLLALENPLAARVILGEDGMQLDFARRWSTSGSDLYLGLWAPGAAGEVVAAGTQSGGGSLKGPFVQRLRADGTELWRRQLGAIPVDTAAAVTLGPDRLLYVAGTTFERLGAQAYGQQDVFVAVLDPETGELLRTMQAGSAGSEWVRDLALDEQGRVYVTGGTLGSLPGATSAGGLDAFVPGGVFGGERDGFLVRLERSALVSEVPRSGDAALERVR